MRYEIDENNAVRFYQDGSDVPFLFQPDYPDFSPFRDREDAVAWAEAFEICFNDPNAKLPISPEENLPIN